MIVYDFCVICERMTAHHECVQVPSKFDPEKSMEHILECATCMHTISFTSTEKARKVAHARE